MNDTAKDLQATIIFEATPREQKSAVADVSQAPVGFVSGTAPQFSDETAALLRSRLMAASLLLAITLTIAFVRNLFAPEQFMVVLRAAVLVVMIASYFILRGRIALSLAQLRFIELAVFGGLVIQLGLMQWSALNQFAAASDFVTAIGANNLFIAAFCVVIFIYGMLMPNTWRRAAAVLLPVATIPYVLIYASQVTNEQVVEAFQTDHFKAPVPLPFVAAFAAVYGTHVVNSIRREAFKARQFGQYRLKDKLGAGGMGEVYRAEHMLLKRPCAIKLIKASNETDAAALAHFEREVQSTAKLSHWNSVEIFDYGHTDDGVFYYVMEYLPGKSLGDLVEQHGPLPPERVVHFLRQCCRALREAHQLGLVHRDLKPANIFAAKVGGVCDVAKILDFGLVKQSAADSNKDVSLKPTATFSGSPLYMSPEQAEAYDEVDGRGDIYSLGAVAYHLLTGKPPFEGGSVIDVLMAHANKQAVPPSKIVSTIPADLEKIVLRCLEKNPKDRFQDVASLERALAACECADKWTEDKAEQWWSDAGVSMA
jgi:serine/threonine-protein kinase